MALIFRRQSTWAATLSSDRSESDDAARAYLEWMDEVSQDPDVQAVWQPTGGVVPPVAQAGPLLMEANWVIHHCSLVRMSDFDGGAIPVIGGPGTGFLPLPAASVAGSYLIQMLQNPPAAYVAINGLGTGTFICTLQYLWSGVLVIIQVTKS